MQYHRRGGSSRTCSGWERVFRPRHGHQSEKMAEYKACPTAQEAVESAEMGNRKGGRSGMVPVRPPSGIGLAASYFPALLNAVSSPRRPFTHVFGMGTGVSSSPWPPVRKGGCTGSKFERFLAYCPDVSSPRHSRIESLPPSPVFAACAVRAGESAVKPHGGLVRVS